MQIQFTLSAHEEPEAYAKIRAIVEVLSGQAQAFRSGGAVVAALFPKHAELEAHAAAGEAETLAKLEAENPQFGRQPLPDGGVHFTAHNEVSSGPLAPPSPPSAPSPAAAAPSTSAPAAPPVSSADVDKNGLPWDERIHSGSRAKVADGSWRMKRGVEPTKIAKVEAELRGQIPAAAPPPPVANPLANLKPEAAPLPPAAPELTFGMVAKRVAAKLTLGELTTAELTKRLAGLGFPDGLHTINARPDMWLTVLETLGA